MKKIQSLVCIISGLAVLLTACSTDFEVNAPHKEITVVYGLLNQKDTAQYVRVSKGFLGEGDAMEFAKRIDSISYQPGDIDVKLIKLNDNSAIVMQPIEMPKQAGAFSTEKNYIYKTTQSLDDKSKYKLEITNKLTGNVITSETALLKDFAVTYPPYNIQSYEHRLKDGNKYLPFRLDWSATEGGKVYSPKIRFHYKEKDLTTNITSNKFIDISLPEQRTDKMKSMSAMLEGEEFYKTLQLYIPKDSNVKRWAQKDSVSIEIFITVGSEELTNYMDVNKPSSGIVQEKPDYTNIVNGLGLFSARYVKVIAPKRISSDSEQELEHGQYTIDLFDYF